MLTKSQLAIALSKLKVFSQAQVTLEQYPTDSEIAATMLWHAFMQGDIQGKLIADYGAGTGILGIGALLLGARQVVFLEHDPNALAVLEENLRGVEGERKILNGTIGEASLPETDTVIMNPPFGTKQKHADRVFLSEAFHHATNVYSLHKTSTVAFLVQFARHHGRKVIVLEEFSFPLKSAMKFHRKPVKKIAVSFLKFEKNL